MPCDKTIEGLEGTIGLWDYLSGNFFPDEDLLPEPVNPNRSPSCEVAYYYRVNPATQDVEYQFPPSKEWIVSR